MSNKVDKNLMNTLPYIVAVDFDGTLVSDKFPEIGEPNTFLIDQIKAWRADSDNNRIILWTCRDDDTDDKRLTSAVEFCKTHNLHFDAVNRNIDEVIDMFKNDTRKIYANEYIDDKAVEFIVPTEWLMPTEAELELVEECVNG